MKTYYIYHKVDFEIDPQIREIAEWETDYDVDQYVHEDAIVTTLTVPDEWATVLELALDVDSNVYEYVEKYEDPRDNL